MSLFLSSCFSFQNRTDLVLVKFCFNAAVQRFLKTFRKFAGKRLWWKRFLGKLSYSKWANVRLCLSISFPNTFLWLFPNIERKGISFNDNIIWCKYSRVIQDLSKSESFFLLNAPEILRRKTFLFSISANSTYFLKCISLKKSVKLKRLFWKHKSSQKSKYCLIFKFPAW